MSNGPKPSTQVDSELFIRTFTALTRVTTIWSATTIYNAWQHIKRTCPSL